jgi:alkylation response protein AidB-like acyl-CoA dehydrogenase
MNFSFGPQETALRLDIQDFLASHLTDAVKAELDAARRGERKGPALNDFMQHIVRRGWSGVSWPREYGGQGRSPLAQFVVEEEFWRAYAIHVGGGGTGAPAILASGTLAQKRFFIPASIRFEITFCQGFSEPHCGTDLAGIRCKAVRRDDHYIVSGQKIYTTFAQHSTHIFLLVRTDPESRRRSGLSVLLVPMDSPGITIRPLWTIQSNPQAPAMATYAEPRTNEVFFDEVRVPVSERLGDEGQGWEVAQRGLNLDRIAAFRYLISTLRDEDIVNLLKQRPDLFAQKAQDPAVRDKVADLWTEAQVCRLMTMRSLSMVCRGKSFSHEGAAEKVFAPEHGVRSTEAIAQILGPYAQLLSDSPETLMGGLFTHNLLGAFQSTVNHGSVQVMRDQVARRALLMPRSATS